jgi:predicted acyltransferase
MQVTKEESPLPASALEGVALTSSRRLLSLDVFRGITVAGMILVNNPGDWGNVYPPLLHAPWHGLTPTDLVFPFFLFIVGVSIVYALSTRREDPTQHGQLLAKILKRSLILFGLGLLLNLVPAFDFGSLRIPGVLQRIAVVFLVCALIFLKTNRRTQIYLLAGLLLGYWFLMTLVPVPGVGPANLEPTTNLAAWLDNLVMAGHMYSVTKVWDPEGILSTLPAIGTGLCGVLAGQWLRQSTEPATKVAWLFVYGCLAVVAGLVWDLAFPINKPLWTSSYVLYTAGLALNGLALLYWLVDVQGHKGWTTPFVIYGVNAIVVFVGSGLLFDLLGLIPVTGPAGEQISLTAYLYQTFFTPFFTPVNASLAWAVSYVLFWLGVLWVLYRRRIIIKV